MESFTKETFPQIVEDALFSMHSTVWRTPLYSSMILSDLADVSGGNEYNKESVPKNSSHDTNTTRCYLKLESEQVTGSFKVRGAVHKVNEILKDIRSSNGRACVGHQIITASTGNHALAVAYAVANIPDANALETHIYLPKNANKGKLHMLKRLGVNLELVESDDCADAEVIARRAASEKSSATFISPYNDRDVIVGQATIAAEAVNQFYSLHPSSVNIDYILVPVGGGGMISGIAMYMKSKYPRTRIIGCQPTSNACMAESIKANRILCEGEYSNGPTLSDGTAGGVEANSLTFDICNQYVDEWVLVDEEKIAEALTLMVDKHHKIVEGSAGVALAAYMSNTQKFAGKNTIVICCGSNIDSNQLRRILAANP